MRTQEPIQTPKKKGNLIAWLVMISLICIVLATRLNTSWEFNPFPKKTESEGYNIVVILIDTLRPDHLGCYGYERKTSPNIDAIARESIVFKNCVSVAPWTNPTIASLFTGLLPRKVLEPTKHVLSIKDPLPENVDTLAETLGDNGYRTIAIVDHPGINKELGFDRGFGSFIDTSQKDGWHQWFGSPQNEILDEIKEQIRDAKGEKFFMYVHMIYPHQPYTPPEPYTTLFGKSRGKGKKENKQEMINGYDGEIRYSDKLVGDIMDVLRERNMLNNTYVIITADHGEEFWEHGKWEHGKNLYKEQLMVPLIIRAPDGVGEAGEITAYVSNIDLPPTLLEFAGLNDHKMDGKSLTRYMKDNGSVGQDDIISGSCHKDCILKTALQDEQYKYIYDPDKKSLEIYSLKDDPDESSDIGDDPGLKTKKENAINKIREYEKTADDVRVGDTGNSNLDDDALKKLKSLGYV